MNERHINLSMRLQKAAFKALENKDFSNMADKDISNFVRIAAELERLARTDDISMYQQETDAEERTEDVVIYVPDNGMEMKDDE